jgi:hypothetical protein
MENRTPMKLIHLANIHSTNIGNGALISGLESTMQEDFPSPISWIREPWDDYTFGLRDFDSEFVKKVNASDGLIVGGAVTFNGRDYNNRTGSRFELPLELWSEIKKPIVFYGLSYRHWPGQPYHHLDRLKLMIEKILSSDNMCLAVRNDGTKDWLNNLTKIDCEQIPEIPDSAVFVQHLDRYCPEILEGVRNIVLSFNDEDACYRFDQESNHKSRMHVINALASVVERLSEEYPVNFVLCPHYFDDYRMMSDFLEKVRPRLAHQQMVSTGLYKIKDTNLFYGRYKQADLSISMRVHSMSPCIGLGTPMVAYTTQDRMNVFMSKIGLTGHVVDAFDSEAAEYLLTKAKYALENSSEIKRQFNAVRESLRRDTRMFHDRIYDLLTS